MNRQSEADILKRMAMNVGEYFGSSNPGELLSGFLAMIGNGYNGELLVYGRAVNGWGDTHQPAAALAAEANATAFAEAALKDAGRENGECPMLWVTELEGPALNADGTQRYNTRRSAFWRTAKALVGRLAWLIRLATCGHRASPGPTCTRSPRPWKATRQTLSALRSSTAVRS